MDGRRSVRCPLRRRRLRARRSRVGRRRTSSCPSSSCRSGSCASVALLRSRAAAPASSHVTTASTLCRRSVRSSVALGSLCVNLSHAAQHLLIDRDPGRVREHRAVVGDALRPRVPCRCRSVRIDERAHVLSPAVYGHGPTMHFQFSHLQGVLLAEARWLGGDHLMFALTPDPRRGVVGDVLRGGVPIRPARVRAPRAPPRSRCRSCSCTSRATRTRRSSLQLVLLGSLWVLGAAGPRCASRGVRRRVARHVRRGADRRSALPGRGSGARSASSRPTPASRPRRSTTASGPMSLRWFAVAVTGAVALLGIVDVAWRVPEYVRDPGLAGRRRIRRVDRVDGLLAIWLGRRAEHGSGAFATVHATSARARRRRASSWSSSRCGSSGRTCNTRAAGRRTSYVSCRSRLHLAVDPGRQYYQTRCAGTRGISGPRRSPPGSSGAACSSATRSGAGPSRRGRSSSASRSSAASTCASPSITPDQLWVMRRFVPDRHPGVPAVRGDRRR